MKEADAIWNDGPELIDEDGEVRELTREDFARMRPFAELPEELKATLLGLQVAKASEEEEKVAVPVSLSVVERFRVSGSGWESRLDEALRDWLDRQAS